MFLIGTDIESLYASAYGDPRNKLIHAQQRVALAGRRADPGSNDRHRLDCGSGAQTGICIHPTYPPPCLMHAKV